MEGIRWSSLVAMRTSPREYQHALARCEGQVNYDDQGKAHTYRYNQANEGAAADKILEVLRFLPSGCDVYLIGLWVWIMGTEKSDAATRANLKNAGCLWHGKRGCWYWRPETYRHYSKGKFHSLNNLAYKYGCSRFAVNESAVEVA
jgi:hypothetical protein